MIRTILNVILGEPAPVKKPGPRLHAIHIARHMGLHNTADMWSKMTDDQYDQMERDAMERYDKIKRTAGRW